jgi:hypothetical protein
VDTFPGIQTIIIDEQYAFFDTNYSFTLADPYFPLRSLSLTCWIATFISNEYLNIVFPNLKRLKWATTKNCKPALLYHHVSYINLKTLDLDSFFFELKFDFNKRGNVNYIVNIIHSNTTRAVKFTLLKDSSIQNITTVRSPRNEPKNLINIHCDKIRNIRINDEYRLH